MKVRTGWHARTTQIRRASVRIAPARADSRSSREWPAPRTHTVGGDASLIRGCALS